MKKLIARAICFVRGHDYPSSEFRMNCLYFCRRGCGCEIAGRTLADLDDLPPLSADEIDEIQRDIQFGATA